MILSKQLWIPEPQLVRTADGLNRVVARVAGQDVFFESSAELTPKVEALLCAFLLPAMARHKDLTIQAPVSRCLIRNLTDARATIREWWPDFGGGGIEAANQIERPPADAAGLFFTGGVDSTYALHRLKDHVNALIYVEGFDVPPTDTWRLEAVRRWHRSASAFCGLPLLTLRTNLRRHRLFRWPAWGLTHVAALAAAAHCLARHLHTVYVAASDVPPPHGSNPSLDPAWSSEDTTLVNVGAELSRLERVRAIAGWEASRGRIRVCWENRRGTLNCGRCEKCVRTQLQFLVAGYPEGFVPLPAPTLARRIRALPPVPAHLRTQWRSLLEKDTDPARQHAVADLLERSPTTPASKSRWDGWLAGLRRRF